MGERSIPKNDEERVELLAFLVRHTSQLLLDERAEVMPHAVRLLGPSSEVKTYFPQDSHPRAAANELLRLALIWASEPDESAEVVGIAVCAGLELATDPDARALGAQVETGTVAAFLIFPYRREEQGFQIDEFQASEELLVPEGIHWQLEAPGAEPS